MNNLNLISFKHIHFVGIGGVSMYLLAMYCKQLGIEVSGSDIKASNYTNKCKSVGIKIHIGHRRKNIGNADLVVYTSAVDNNNIEIIEAQDKAIKLITRAELLAIVCRTFKCVIGISGTHGKSTTCAMLYHVLKQSGKKVSCHIGADIEGASISPNDEYLVVECCEYNRSFLQISCDISVVLNIDNDHLDCYQNMYNLQNAYKTFLKHAKTRFIFDNPTTKCIKNKALHIKPAEIIDINTFNYNNNKFVLDNVYGKHNINNATVVAEICSHLGISYTKIYRALKTFKSAKRRCEIVGRYKNCDIITDYAHHPTEIENLYNALKLKYGGVYIIFQPHTYSRTKILLHEFVNLFSKMDNLILFKEYPARENKSKGYSALELKQYLDNAIYVKNYNQIKKWLINTDFKDNSCIAFVGAGDINKVAEKVAKYRD